MALCPLLWSSLSREHLVTALCFCPTNRRAGRNMVRLRSAVDGIKIIKKRNSSSASDIAHAALIRPMWLKACVGHEGSCDRTSVDVRETSTMQMSGCSSATSAHSVRSYTTLGGGYEHDGGSRQRCERGRERQERFKA